MKLQDIEGYTPITQKSIDNIKCTRIISGEGSDKYNKYIQYLAKKVLAISVNREDGHKHDEVGILARLDGTYESKPIYGKWNENLQTSVIDVAHNTEYNYILDENMMIQSCIFVHNHPNNSLPSINDLRTLISTPEILGLIAVGNDGKTRYAVKTVNNIEYYIKIGIILDKKLSDPNTNNNILYMKLINNSYKYNLKIGGH